MLSENEDVFNGPQTKSSFSPLSEQTPLIFPLVGMEANTDFKVKLQYDEQKM